MRALIYGLILCLGSHTSVKADQGVTLWILSFDNLYKDSEVGWLSEGFRDFIIEHYQLDQRVSAYRTEDLERTFEKIRKEAATDEELHLVLSGSFERRANRFVVALELTDLREWKSVAEDKVEIETVDLANLIEAVNASVDQMLAESLVGRQPQPDERVAIPGEAAEEFQEITEISRTTKNISLALEELERSIITEPAPDNEIHEPEYRQVTHRREVERKIKDFFDENDSFEDILNRILEDPYAITIGDPQIERLPMTHDYVRLSFEVGYRLRKTIIEDMLETLHYTQKREFDDYTEYKFSGNNYLFAADLVRKISQGNYRYFPVITLECGPQQKAAEIIDAPFIIQREKSTYRVADHFKPLINVATSAWNISIFLLHDEIDIEYELDLPVQVIPRITSISLCLLNEDGITTLVTAQY